MRSNENPAKVRFDELFSRLLATVAEEEELKSRNEAVVELIDVKDRLHALRSALAATRCGLTRETARQPCTLNVPSRAVAWSAFSGPNVT